MGTLLTPPLDAVTQEKLLELLNRDPHPSGGGVEPVHIKNPKFPQYRFEWHPKSRKVYLVRLGHVTQEGVFVPKTDGPLTGEILAEHAETHGMAFGFVQTFLRGFIEGRTPDVPKHHLEG